ncbi:unnamed protein product [Toxocara canis]|uniref:Alpha-1,3-mannosyl-glycoprotein 2-beta-N-acetylglucosaminyltransferase n=1 Tax=Toxocara canis TaxID=6265 RepID=A0A183USI3_TOXCA|nr:unnamed protein product [Toxocara canis]
MYTHFYIVTSSNSGRLTYRVQIRRQLYEIYRVEHPEATAARVTFSPSRKVARIAVNVIACDRTAELKNLLNDISRLLPKSDQFGVFVSLGCDNDASRQVAEQFANFVVLEPEWRNATRDRESIRNSHAPPKRAKSTAYLARLSPQHREALLKDGGFYEYNRVSNQYKYSLTYSFDIFDYDYALFIEENSLISNDFFEYFLAGEHLSSQDSSLFCISAWNDNGIPALIMHNNSLLWRTDFFSGVGWMISSSTWSDLIDEWPEVFWDEWVRATMHRQKKACIRPEVSRIAITDDSFSSRDILAMEPYDLFKYITLNAEPYDFTSANLNYLLRERYDDELDRRISEAIMIEENDITKGVVNRYKSSLKIYYSTESQFERLSAAFKYVPYSQIITKGIVNRYKSSLKIHYSTEIQFERLSAMFNFEDRFLLIEELN